MDEECVAENVTRKIEKRAKKKSNKCKRSEENTIGMQEGRGIVTVKAIEHVQISEKEDVTEMERVRKRDKEKKKNKEIEIKKGAGESEQTAAYGEESSGDAVDNAVKKRKKREKDKNRNGMFETGINKEVEGKESKRWSEGESVSGTTCSKERKTKKAKRNHDNGDSEKEKEDGNEVGTRKQNSKIPVERKKRKKEKIVSEDDNCWQESSDKAKHVEGDLSSMQKENVPGNVESVSYVGNATKELKRKKKKKKKSKERESFNADSVDKHTINDDTQIDGVEYGNKRKKKKKAELVENSSDDARDTQVEYASKGKKRKTKTVENDSDDRISDTNDENRNVKQDDLVRGKRFTLDEDNIVKESVYKYIHERQLGDEGLNMVLNCKKHPEIKGCWREIASAIPYRPYLSIYFRAQVLLRRSVFRKWTPEEYEKILNYHENHDNEWKALADELGEHQKHVRNTWCRIKMRDMNRGRWSQEEYQKLFDLVNIDLRSKVSQVKRSQHGMFRDNISWTMISEQLSTRPQARCCSKWYSQLTSRMVAEGVWADSDDYRLIDALYSLDATCVEDVDWDSLVEERSGIFCRKRWNQMALHIGHNTRKSFSEQVEILAQRYCPSLLEAREAWDSKPYVD
ncbi:hypothetical protein ABFX02_04G169400 [Erythranthe guttata]